MRSSAGNFSSPVIRPRGPGPSRCISKATLPRRVRPFLVVGFSLLLWGVAEAQSDAPVRVMLDTVGDAVPRPTDAGVNRPIDPAAHRLPDIIRCSLACWQPDDPQADLFTGSAVRGGGFFRLDIVFDGLVNPPGTNGCCGYPFAPFKYGPHPVFGYVEIDMDANVNTGGELDTPWFRYLGNAARFGGLPLDRHLAYRAARDASAFDQNVTTPPLVERSGEEFHLALHGWEITDINGDDNADSIFDPGETWIITGYLFSRAHGYDPFSYAYPDGGYSPLVKLRFAHDPTPVAGHAAGTTRLSLVFPLTNAAAASLSADGTSPEPPDNRTDNQASIAEALNELVWSVRHADPEWPNDPAFALIAPWGHFNLWGQPNDVSQFLDPTSWRVNAIVASSYIAPSNDGAFVWTDVLPDVVPGDFNADGLLGWKDYLLFKRFLKDSDGVRGRDEDLVANCEVDIISFGPNFSVFDVNYDGFVNPADAPPLAIDASAPGDFDRDGDVDQTDFSHLQQCMTGRTSTAPTGNICVEADFDMDGDVDGDDFTAFRKCASGPAIPADPTCGESQLPACMVSPASLTGR